MIEYLGEFFDRDGERMAERYVSAKDKTTAREMLEDLAKDEGMPYDKLKVYSTTYNAVRLREYLRVKNIKMQRESVPRTMALRISERLFQKWRDIHRITGVQFSKLVYSVVRKHIEDSWNEYFLPEGNIRDKLGETERSIVITASQDSDTVRLNYEKTGIRCNDTLGVIITESDLERILEKFEQKYGEDFLSGSKTK